VSVIHVLEPHDVVLAQIGSGLDLDDLERDGAWVFEPVLGAEQTEGVIRRVNAPEELDDVRELRRFLAREGH